MKKEERQKMKLFEKLKVAKVPKNKKWIYTLIAWVLEHKNYPYQNIQARIDVSLNHNKGYYKSYYEVNRHKHNMKMKDVYKKNKKLRMFYNKIKRLKGSKVLRLYNQGLLSNKSIKIIDKELEKIDII